MLRSKVHWGVISQSSLVCWLLVLFLHSSFFLTIYPELILFELLTLNDHTNLKKNLRYFSCIQQLRLKHVELDFFCLPSLLFRAKNLYLTLWEGWKKGRVYIRNSKNVMDFLSMKWKITMGRLVLTSFQSP